MEKEEFNKLDTLKQVDYLNDLLGQGQTLTKITNDLEVVRSTLGRNFKKAGYVYDSTTKQFAKSTLPHESKINNKPNVGKKRIDHKVDYVEADKIDHRPIRRLKFSIPIKTRLKNTTKAFNVVMDKTLVERIDKLAKLKGGYSRNQIINMMCEFSLDNMDEK